MQPDFFLHIKLLGVIGLVFVLLILPVSAFTSQSLTITIDPDGNATAVFRFALEGFVENAIPESVLEEELVKGLATSEEPPEVLAFDKAGATLRLKKFALVRETTNGTEYLTTGMDFTKAEDALKNSAVSSVISADFTPQVTTVIFPDGFQETLTDASVLPTLRHVAINPEKLIATRQTTQNRGITPEVTSPPEENEVHEREPETGEANDSGSIILGIVGIIALIGLAGAGVYYFTSQWKR